jgi:hypothetical protein
MTADPPSCDDPIADIVDLHRDHTDPLVDRYLADAGREAADPDSTLQRLDDALPRPAPALRLTVAVLGILQLVAVLPWLIGHDPIGLLGDSNTAHLTRDGALGLVVAVAALLATWRPHWARPSFAIASAAVVAQAAAGALDTTAATGGNELIHLPSVALACLTGALAIRLTALAPRGTR